MSDEEYFEQLVSSSLDGTLTDSEREKLAEHLAECPSCAALKQDLEQMRALFAEEAEMPEGLHASIMQRLEQESKLRVVQPEKPARRMPVFTMVAAAAVVVLVVLGGGLMPAFSTVGNATTTTADSAAAYGDTEAGQQVADAAEDAGLTAGGADGTAEIAGGTSGQTVQPRGNANAGAVPSEGAVHAESGAPAESQPNLERDASVPSVASAEDLPSLALPDSLRGTSVAHCYFADGGAELPDIDGKMVDTIDGFSWFLLDNNMTNLQETLGRLEEAGFTVTAYEDVGLPMDSKASSWLLIVETAA